MVKLCGEQVLEIGFEGNGRLVSQPISSTRVFGYGEPTQAANRRDATVERFKLGETSIVHHGNRIAVEIDLSGVTLPPLSQIRFIRTTLASEGEGEHESFAIRHPEKLGIAGPLTVDLYRVKVPPIGTVPSAAAVNISE